MKNEARFALAHARLRAGCRGGRAVVYLFLGRSRIQVRAMTAKGSKAAKKI